jgi:hypothetical protein
MSSGSLRAATPESGGGRAFGPGPRTALAVALIATIAIAATLVIALNSSGGHRVPLQAASVHRYGHLPSWLPKISNGASKLEVARPASPILEEEQGYTVRAELPSGATNVTASGPEIPNWVASAEQTGKLSDDDSVPGTFVVTLIGTHGTVPISAGAFTILTDAGRIVHPKVTLAGGGRLPAALHAGQHVNLNVRGGVDEGSGSIRWAPLGRKVLVGWIYQVELD